MIVASEVVDRLRSGAAPELQSWLARRSDVVVARVREALATVSPRRTPAEIHVTLLKKTQEVLKTQHGRPDLWEVSLRTLVRDLPDADLATAYSRSNSSAASREDETAAKAGGMFATAAVLRDFLGRERRERREAVATAR